MSQTQTLQRNDPERGVEFVPYGAADKIKLSVKIIQNIVAVPTKSGKTCTERDALRFLMLCQAQRLNPFAGDAYLVGYDTQNGPQFSLITAHQAFLKRAETCPDFEGMESGIIVLVNEDTGEVLEREGDFYLESERVVGAWARVHRKGRRPTYRRLRMSRFNTGFAQWKVDAAGMCVKCVEADSLRSTFPTLLGGLYMQGEQTDAGRIVTDMVTSKPIFEAPVREIAPPKSNSDDDDGDLGPQKNVPQPSPQAAGGSTPQNAPGGVIDPPAPSGEKEKPAESAEAAGKRYVKALKGLLSLKGHSEVELMSFLHERHKVDDSLGTLSALATAAPVTLQKVHDQFATYEAELRAWKEEAK